MASSFPIRRVTASLARQQPRIIPSSRRLASSSATQTQNPAYPLYPSVTQLLHEKGIPDSEVPKIPASGPKGRLLKGDVLAYLGLISAEYPAAQASRIEKLGHLDLSNIKIAAPALKPEETPAPAAVEEPVVTRPPPTTSVAVAISLATVLSAQKKIQDTLGVSVPLSTFLARATDLANDDLPRSANEKPSADELFDEILGGEPVLTSRGEYIPELNAFETAAEAAPVAPVEEDIIDFLSGKASKPVAQAEVFEPTGAAMNVFSVTVPVGEEKRARTFLERVQALLTAEPARLVL